MPTDTTTAHSNRRRRVSRRRFVGDVALGTAGAATVCTQIGCSSEASSQEVGSRAFLRPSRLEWKRREIHPRADRGWSDTKYKASNPGVPSPISVFGTVVDARDFAAALADTAIEIEIVYAFWDGTFVRQRETVASIDTLADRLGASLPESREFVVARSPSRASIFDGVPARVAEQVLEPDYRYRLSFPRTVALESGVVVFQLDTELRFYAFAVEGYGARAFVKYFEELEGTDTFEGPEDTALDDYVVGNIPVDDYFDLESESRFTAVPGWR